LAAGTHQVGIPSNLNFPNTEQAWSLQVSHHSLVNLFNVHMERSGLVENRVLSVHVGLCVSPETKSKGCQVRCFSSPAEMRIVEGCEEDEGCEVVVKLGWDLNSKLLLKYVLY